MPDAIELSSDIGLVAVGLLTTNILLGLLISTGYNPVRRWPRRRIKLFVFHNWTGYIALATTALHAIVILFSKTAGFRLLDIVVPVWSPVQPLENTIGAIGFYLVAFAVVTSYFRHEIGFHTWKLLHFTTYAAAVAFFVHSLLTDPNLKNVPIDWLDGEKVFVQVCMALVAAATAWRVAYGRRKRANAPRRSPAFGTGLPDATRDA